MIVFVVDAGNRDEFGARFGLTFPALRDRFRVVDYGALADVDPLLWATYVFFDLRRSPPARVQLAAELESMIRAAGAPVFNAPSSLVATAGDEKSDPAGPLALRAETPDSIAETTSLDSMEACRDLWAEWVLDGTEPSLIQVLRGPAEPNGDGRFRMGGFLWVGQTLAPLPTMASKEWPVRVENATLEAPFGASVYEIVGERQPLPESTIARVEFEIELGQPRRLRVDDGAACLLRPPRFDDIVREQVEARLIELDSPNRPESPIPICWRPRIRPMSPSS